MHYRGTGGEMMAQGKGRRVSMEVANYRHTLKTKIKLRMEIRKADERMM